MNVCWSSFSTWNSLSTRPVRLRSVSGQARVLSDGIEPHYDDKTQLRTQHQEMVSGDSNMSTSKQDTVR